MFHFPQQWNEYVYLHFICKTAFCAVFSVNTATCTFEYLFKFSDVYNINFIITER